jgi:hypothetical protein
MRISGHWGVVVLVFGIVGLIIGASFIGLAVQKNNLVAGELRAQNVTLGLSQDQIKAGQVVDNAQTAQTAASLLGQHLKSIAPTYGDLMAKNPGGKYDPTNPTNLTYTQGLNMENSMNLAVLSFGVIQIAEIMGGGLVAIGLAVGAIGLVLLRLAQKEKVAEEKKAKSGALSGVPLETR